MCQIIPTSTPQRELADFLEEIAPKRAVNDVYVGQYEPWHRSQASWTDDDLELLLRSRKHTVARHA